MNESSFKLIFSTKEAAKECVKQYKKYLYPDGLSDDDVEYETLYYTPQPQASFTVMDQYTGYVKAIVGGRGSKKVSLGLDRATQSTRQARVQHLKFYQPMHRQLIQWDIL